MTTSEGVVVVGSGQAAAQLAMSLRQKGNAAPVTPVGEEPHLPYERPPLSKARLGTGRAMGRVVSERTASGFVDKHRRHGVDVRFGTQLGCRARERRRARACDRHSARSFPRRPRAAL